MLLFTWLQAILQRELLSLLGPSQPAWITWSVKGICRERRRSSIDRRGSSEFDQEGEASLGESFSSFARYRDPVIRPLNDGPA